MRRNDFAGHDRVAQRGMPADRVDAEARGDRLEPVRIEARMDHGRQQQGIEDGLREADAGRLLLEPQEAKVERRVVRDQHGVRAELVERRQHLDDRRLAREHGGLDARDARRLR